MRGWLMKSSRDGIDLYLLSIILLINYEGKHFNKAGHQSACGASCQGAARGAGSAAAARRHGRLAAQGHGQRRPPAAAVPPCRRRAVGDGAGRGHRHRPTLAVAAAGRAAQRRPGGNAPRGPLHPLPHRDAGRGRRAAHPVRTVLHQPRRRRALGRHFMTIDWNSFTPWGALIGGLAIGLASALFVLGNGRIAGIAGIVGGAWHNLLGGGGAQFVAMRWLFVLGLAVAPWLWQLAAPLPASTVDVGWAGAIAAGLLVGVGTRMGNGCTSGHGVCGLSRLSKRSLVNVLAFMGSGFATVAVLRHL